MESFEKRKRERKKQEQRKVKAARKLQGGERSGPSVDDYFADPGADSNADEIPADEESTDDAKTQPDLPGSTGA
jgi:hypothetical protein